MKTGFGAREFNVGDEGRAVHSDEVGGACAGSRFVLCVAAQVEE